MDRIRILFAITILISVTGIISANAQDSDNSKLIIITLDGLRWQELFTGADAKLVGHADYVSDSLSLKNKFWRETPEERRAVLMPFVWNEVVEMGRIHGNRAYGSKMNLTNNRWFSYPGYNEILTGKQDDERIDSNSKIPNPNVTILEKLNKSDAYLGKVAVFGSWDVFPYIVNEQRSGVYVNAGFESAKGENLTEIEQFLNLAQPNTPSPWGTVRLDMFTHNYALEYMKRMRPDVVYIAYGETDDFAHNGNYQAYLNSAHSTDQFLEKLWSYTQSDSYYRGRTTFILTTDHGRGTEPLDTWRSHGTDIEGADEVWLIAYGAGIDALGEVKEEEQLYTPVVVEMVESIVDY